jgi:acyl-CoA synthetase (AMP-forming)/AMP-acid ligase II
VLLKKLRDIWQDHNDIFLIYGDEKITFADVTSQLNVLINDSKNGQVSSNIISPKNVITCPQVALDLSEIQSGDVVAFIGDFTPSSILTLLRLIDLQTIVVPLTKETVQQHSYFYDAALVDVIIDGDQITRRTHQEKNPLIDALRIEKKSGLVFFSTGTTGLPKAILHDFSQFSQRFNTPKPSMKILNFLLFDHVGGINTLFHALFSKSVVIAPKDRSVEGILRTCQQHNVEVLPTTPTFLRMLLISGLVPQKIPTCLKIITYGTELMDQPTLDALCELLPQVDFRQTFGMSELGIVRVKSESRHSLFMKVGGEGIETQVKNDMLYIRSQSRMLGYLNASDPFDDNGWYNTNDIVVQKDDYYKVVGRNNDVINVGGLKFMASDVEQVALQYPQVALVKVLAKKNPITGQHVEILVQMIENIAPDKIAFMNYFKQHLQAHMVPKRIKFESVNIGHRFKKS